MNDSNEREGKCFVVLEGMFFFFFGRGRGGVRKRRRFEGIVGMTI